MRVMSNEGVALVQFGEGRRVPAMFYRGEKMTVEGKAVACDRIRQVKPSELGQPDINDMPVHKCHKRMYPKEWAEYEASGKNLSSGTSLERWPALSLDNRVLLQQHGIQTVEQIVQHQDMMGAIMGSHGLLLHGQAVEFLRTSQELERLQQQDAMVSDLKAELEQVRAQIRDMQIVKPAEAPKRRGRPRKEDKLEPTLSAE